MKGETCNLIARNTLPMKRNETSSVKDKTKKIEVIFCAVGDGMIETAYLKPQRSLMHIFTLCWQYIIEAGEKGAGK